LALGGFSEEGNGKSYWLNLWQGKNNNYIYQGCISVENDTLITGDTQHAYAALTAI